MEDWKKIPDLKAWMETAEYTKWRSFRESEDARYIGLVFPRFMLRLPYGPDSVPVKGFNYQENVKGPDHEKYLWGNASFAFASNMVRAFANDGWCVQIRGPQAGGMVENLPVHLYDAGKGKQMKIPTEVPIDETTEFTAANLGFIPLSHYQGRDYACFFSANSTQKPAEYDQKEATANSRINARLPYIFLSSRIAHYLKVIQRENIGSVKDRTKIEKELNTWIKGLIIGMKDPSEQQIAKYPLRDAQVKVYDIEENPGFFRVEMMIMPHFQIEGMDISLSLVGKMPKGK
jgi:type VI secretion system protein ImpC